MSNSPKPKKLFLSRTLYIIHISIIVSNLHFHMILQVYPTVLHKHALLVIKFLKTCDMITRFNVPNGNHVILINENEK